MQNQIQISSKTRLAAAASQMADRRLILAIAAENLNGLADMMGEYITVDELVRAGVLAPDADPLTQICEFLSDCGAWFGPRRYLESDGAWRQLLPYIVMRQDDLVLTYQRGAAGEENRLHGLRSLGFGGHIDIGDVKLNEMQELSLKKTVLAGAVREGFEEAGVYIMESAIDCTGLIIAKQTEVDEVHVALVLEVQVSGTIASREDSQLDLQWRPREVLDPEGLETWSALVAAKLKAPED